MKNMFSRKYFLSLTISAFSLSSILFWASSCTKDTGIKPSNNIVTENRTIRNILKVDVENDITVHIKIGNEESLHIETSDNLLQYVETITKGTTLTIERRDGYYYHRDAKIDVYLTLKNIDELDVSGASRVYLDSLFNSSSVSIDVSGASFVGIKSLKTLSASFELSGASFVEMTSLATPSVSIELSGASEFSSHILYSSRLDADLSGASSLRLQGGNTNYYYIEISGASSASDLNFETDHLYCELDGASSLRVKVNRKLSIKASGASKVIYTGDGNIINQELTGGSTVHKE